MKVKYVAICTFALFGVAIQPSLAFDHTAEAFALAAMDESCSASAVDSIESILSSIKIITKGNNPPSVNLATGSQQMWDKTSNIDFIQNLAANLERDHPDIYNFSDRYWNGEEIVVSHAIVSVYLSCF